MRPRHSLAVVLLTATALSAVACGAGAPTTPEAAAVLSPAISSTLTRTLRSSTYCQTVQPDFSFASMGQMDLVEMLQNVLDKGPLNDAATAGAVHIELKEFRVAPGGRSPDPSCDTLHAQYRQSGPTGPVRFAVVRTTLTPKGKAAGIEFDTPIEVATRELVEVTHLRPERGGAVAVTYLWRWKATTMAEVIGYTPAAAQQGTARLRRAGGRWVVADAGVTR